MISPQEDAYYEKIRQQKRQAYAQLNRQCLTYPELIFLGDSIMEWFPIDQLLDIKQVWVNRGLAAATSQHLLDHLDNHVFGTLVTAVVLLIGTNDLGYGRSLADIVASVRALIEAIQADQPLATIHLLEVLPVNEGASYTQVVRNRKNQAIQALNQAYADLADDLFGVQLLACNQVFSDENGQLDQDLTTDGLHLSPAGYAVLAEAIQQALAG